jgi:hypothetical protein
MPANIVTLSQYIANPDAQLSDDSVLEVRGFFTHNFISGDGVTPIYGNATNGEQGPYESISATLNASGKVVVAAHDIEVTTLSNPTARYFEILFVDGAASQIFIPNTQGATGWQVPSVYGTPINFGELALYNRAQRLVYPPNTYFTADQTIQEIDLRAGQFDYAAVNRNGITSISVAPALASLPIAVGDNDPRVNFTINVQYAPYNAVGNGIADDTDALNAAFAVVGATVVIPEGTYKTTSKLTAPVCEQIIGAGSDVSILKPTSAVSAFMDVLNGGPALLQGFSVNGSSTTSARGLKFGDTAQSGAANYWAGRVIDVLVYNFTGIGGLGVWYCDSLKAQFEYLRCRANYRGMLVQGTDTAVPTNTEFDKCEFTQNTTQGVKQVTGAGIVFGETCLFESNGEEGLLVPRLMQILPTLRF